MKMSESSHNTQPQKITPNLLLLLMFFWFTTAGAVVSIDNVSTVVESKPSILTTMHTTSGVERLMIVGISMLNTDFETVTSVTYNGTALSLVGAIARRNDSRVELWSYLNPPATTANVVVNFTSEIQEGAGVTVITFNGVDQSSSFVGSFQSQDRQSSTASIDVNSASGELVLAVLAAERQDDNPALIVGTPQWSFRTQTGDNSTVGAGATELGSVTTTLTWDLNESDDWVIGAMSIMPIPFAPAPPLLEYRFDEMSWNGTTNEVTDNTSNNLDGSAVGDTNTITTGQVCRAGTFDGSGDYINASGIDTYLSTTASLSFWIKTKQNGNDTPWRAPGIVGVERRLSSNDIFWGYVDASGHIGIQKGNGNPAQSDTAINDDNWHHVVLTWDSLSGDVQVFVDGKRESRTTSDNGDVSTTFSNVGRIENSESRLNFIGQLDELLIFDSVLSPSNVSFIYNSQHKGDNYDGTARVCPTNVVDHYEILHNGNGFTCEAETVTIKACADEECDIPYTEPVSIALSPSGWIDGDTITIENGEITTSLSVTEESTITIAKTNASPEADLYCFNGATETCDIKFSNDGFEFIGATTAIKTLNDQESETNFSNVNIRAVRDEAGVCKALLEGPQDIIFTYNCQDPSSCLTSLGDISINSTPNGDQSGALRVSFSADGIAPLSMLNYADAGRLQLSAQALIDGVKIDSGETQVDVVPAYLKLTVTPTTLNYTGNSDNDTYTAAENFTFTLGAYGASNSLLPNYQPGSLQFDVVRVAPTATGSVDGIFSYAKFIDVTAKVGEYNYNANYSEVGRINLTVQDNNYLPDDNNPISVIKGKDGDETLSLGNFIPAYFTVTQTQPELQNTCGDTFSYIGETIGFVAGSEPLLIFTGKNAQNAVTKNYGITPWILSLSQLDVDNGVSLVNKSTGAATDSFDEVSKGSIPLITTGSADYDGIIEVQILDTSLKYNKVRPDNTTFDIPSPFAASIDMEFSSILLTDENGVCYQLDYENSTCLPFTISNITGANMRYGRLTLESTYGPENEPINVPIKTEYFDSDHWRINTDDNCTSIDLTQTAGQILITPIDGYDIDLVGDVESAGKLLLGVAVGDQFRLKAPDPSQLGPGIQGQLELSLVPTAMGIKWPNYLNYNWNHTNNEDDNTIDSDDYPEATVTFGRFRGNDRIIHWREVFK